MDEKSHPTILDELRAVDTGRGIQDAKTVAGG